MPFDDDEPTAIATQLTTAVEPIVDTIVRSGIADRDRIGVGGTCLGAYAAVMLLTHSDLSRVGIACNGLYHLAASPLGGAITAHRRLWEAPELFVQRSVICAVDRSSRPILLFHGGMDEAGPASASRDLFDANRVKRWSCKIRVFSI